VKRHQYSLERTVSVAADYKKNVLAHVQEGPLWNGDRDILAESFALSNWC